jgi:hypothetical protein
VRREDGNFYAVLAVWLQILTILIFARLQSAASFRGSSGLIFTFRIQIWLSFTKKNPAKAGFFFVKLTFLFALSLTFLHTKLQATGELN